MVHAMLEEICCPQVEKLRFLGNQIESRVPPVVPGESSNVCVKLWELFLDKTQVHVMLTSFEETGVCLSFPSPEDGGGLLCPGLRTWTFCVVCFVLRIDQVLWWWVWSGLGEDSSQFLRCSWHMRNNSIVAPILLPLRCFYWNPLLIYHCFFSLSIWFFYFNLSKFQIIIFCLHKTLSKCWFQSWNYEFSLDFSQGK